MTDVHLQLRRDSSTDWTTENPVLAAGEPGWDQTRKQLKIGDGSTAWNSLPYLGLEVIMIALGDEITAVTTGTAKVTFRMPYPFLLTAVRSSVTSASSSGLYTIDLNEAGSSVLSTKLSIDQGEFTSVTAATPAVISDSSLADDAQMTVDFDAAGVGVKGPKLHMYGYRLP